MPDPLPALFVGADDIHERAIFVEQKRQRVRIMHVPCVGIACYKLICNSGHARMLAQAAGRGMGDPEVTAHAGG